MGEFLITLLYIIYYIETPIQRGPYQYERFIQCPWLIIFYLYKFYNLGTTNAIKMKLTTTMYLHKTFDLA